MRIDPIVEQYPVRIRSVIVFVLLGLSLTFYAFPRFLGEPERLIQDYQPVVEPDTMVAYITDPPPKQPPPRPAVVRPADDDEITDCGPEEIEWPPFEDPIPFDRPPVPSSGMNRFQIIIHEVPPEPIRKISPVYPEIASLAGIEGKVVVGFFVNIDGTVSDAYIHSGMPNTGLDEAALEAVNKSFWKPAMNQDKKVAVWMLVPIDFKLN